ncbi:MAG: hypothetical protein ABI439_02150 [Rhodospirillales bacterium]
MMRLALALLCAIILAAPAHAENFERCPAQLPAAVAAKRAAILAAAKTNDFVALKNLASTVEFTFSFGDAEDPVPYWRELSKGGTDIGKILSAILSMNCVVGEGPSYVWPSAALIDWARLTPDEQKALLALYGKKIDENWLEGRGKGYYVGWRVIIEPDGSWSSFVAGD